MAFYLSDNEGKKTLLGILCFLLVYPLMSLVNSELDCPSSCFCDDKEQFVSCVGDGLWHVPPDIPTSAVRLELRNYIIPTLSNKALMKLTELQELKIHQSEIRYIENGTFLGLQKLQRLELSLNLLEGLNVAIFLGLNELRYLDLSSNKLTSTEEAFQDLKLVEQLNLRANKLTTITSSSLDGLHKVQYLNLDSNNISNIEVGAFQHLTNLAHLILSNNPLTQLSRLDFFGSRLQYIDFSHVGLKHVPQSLTRFVRDLRLAKNNITQIGAGDFDSYPYLGLLVLDDNNITKIENDAFGRLEYLVRLWLNGNLLERIPANLPSCLSALYIEENHVKKLPAHSFRGLNNLEQLFLQRNDIEEMEECAFCDLIRLKNLDLQANKIQNLTKGIFANLTSLESLDLSQNKLRILDSQCFTGLSSLKTLQISRTSTFIEFDDSVFDTLKNLETLELYDSAPFSVEILNSTRGLHGLRKLKELNIMHNKLICLRPDLPSFFPVIKIIKMSGNRWHCDRNILWLTKWLKTTSIQFYRSYDIKCASPTELEYKPIMLLTENDFTVTTTSTLELGTTVEYKGIKTSERVATTDHFMARIYPYGPLIPVSIGPSSTKVLTEEAFPENTSTNWFLDNTSTTVLFNYSHQVFSDNKQRGKLAEEGNNPAQGNVTSNEDDGKSHEHSNQSYVENTLTENVHINTASSYKGTTQSIEIPASNTSYIYTTFSALSRNNKDKISEKKKNNSHALGSVPTTEGYQKSVSTPKGFYVSPVATPHNLAHNNDKTIAIIVPSSLIGGILVMLIGLLVVVAVLRCRKRPDTCGVHRSSSSISYCPHRDEVSILTISEGTVGLKTENHHGLGNKLYYLMENGDIHKDPTKDAIPDPQLQDLLSQLPGENGQICVSEHAVS
ncbi:slit homolog 1 protein-like [Limulus polyphemus]|uniref:Slit homolog 1 protein-like n=1 Tax=Limulus polyphemus TaxID=6850 RepID=A0ABM1BFU4_LIMPO|nr:slit homolog 1 protein-like [Limulus polyphemus]